MGSALPALGIPSKADLYAAALEGLVRVDELLMEKDPAIPPLYEAGARWVKVPHRTWRRADQIAREGWADCEGLSAYRTAELRRSGEDPDARVGIYHTGPAKYHAIVVRGNDDIEDPSIALGMRGRPGMPQTREQMNMVNGMWPAVAVPPSITVGDDGPGTFGCDLVQHPMGGLCGEISIPLASGQTLVARTSPAVDQAVATAKTANMLADTASAIIKNPMMLAQLDPATAAAVAVFTHPEVKKQLKSIAKGASHAARNVGRRLRHLF